MNETYKDTWTDLKFRTRLFWFALIGYIPVTLIVGYPLSKIFHSEKAMVAVAVCWLVLFAVSGIYLHGFKCPRCRKLFFKKKLMFNFGVYNLFGVKCPNCGLRKWS